MVECIKLSTQSLIYGFDKKIKCRNGIFPKRLVMHFCNIVGSHYIPMEFTPFDPTKPLVISKLPINYDVPSPLHHILYI